MTRQLEVLSYEVATAADRTSERQISHRARATIYHLKIANKTGTWNCALVIEALMGSDWIEYFRSTTAFSTDGDRLFVLAPSLLSSRKASGVQESNASPPPGVWRIVLDVTTTTGSADTEVNVQEME